MRWMIILFIFLFLILGCAGESSKGKLTKRQRDSILSESKLPGARTVGKAIEVSDSSKVRAKQIDDLSK